MKKIKLCDIFLALFLNKIALEVIDFHSALNFLRRNHSDNTSGKKHRGFKQTSTCNFKTPLQKRILIASRGRISKLTYLEFRSSFLNLPRAWYSQPVYEEAKIIGKRSIILSTTRQKIYLSAWERYPLMTLYEYKDIAL